MKKLLIVLGILSLIASFTFAFLVPSDPFVIVPSLTGFEYPLWLVLGLVIFFPFFLILFHIYDKLYDSEDKK